MSGVFVSLLDVAAASADEPATDQTEAAPVKLFVDVEDSEVRIDSKATHRTCSGPCVVSVPPGYYTVTASSATAEVYVDRPTRVRLTRPSPGAKTVSMAMLIGGAVVAVAALVVPLLVCTDHRYTDLHGQMTVSQGICSNVSTPVQIAWVIGGGAGLTVGLIGGIGVALFGPQIRTAEWTEASKPKPNVALTPFVTPAREGERPLPAAGLSLQVTF